MKGRLVEIIEAENAALRNTALEQALKGASAADVLRECDLLEQYRHAETNLYKRVRALFFLYAIHRFHLPPLLPSGRTSLIPYDGYQHLLNRRFEEAIDTFLSQQKSQGPTDGISSALAAAYHDLGFQTLADQVRRSVRSVSGNQWMFRVGHALDQPLRVRPELLHRQGPGGSFPVLVERTPVRMDLTHSAWSDIFFLGMDFPEGARVLNVSVDLGVFGRDTATKPPVEAYLRVIAEPVIRLVSVDLQAQATITTLGEMFDFARDYLGLLKAALIASGIVPPGIEGSGQRLDELLSRVVGPGLGLELVSNVNNIPKGSRLAVSTNLLGAMISVCMRATRQAAVLEGPLTEADRRAVAARAILGEWLGGSGGGWQDSGGVWPGIKLITGAVAAQGDPEFGVSRGRLMPSHKVLGEGEIGPDTVSSLEKSLVLVHGGMAQNVGPILEMVTEKYLLRSPAEWEARKEAIGVLDEILTCLKTGDIQKLGRETTRNYNGPLQSIIPWADTLYTQTLIRKAKEHFGKAFWGFWMLGGMSGGGMGFMFAPDRKDEAKKWMQQMMLATRRELQHALPFAMDPVVYDFAINTKGTSCELRQGDAALLPAPYYAVVVPDLIRSAGDDLGPERRAELARFAAACRTRPDFRGMVEGLFDRLFPKLKAADGSQKSLRQLLDDNGFDAEQHERIRADLRSGRIGLSQNRLPANTTIEDVLPSDITDCTGKEDAKLRQAGLKMLKEGRVAVVTLAAGAGSRWTQGAGVCKALNPFCRLGGKHRTFIEVHLAKSRRISKLAGAAMPHVITTGYLTHEPTREFLEAAGNYAYPGRVILSPGKSVGQRLIPMVRDLRFAWEEVSHKVLDAQKQKVRESLQSALIGWAQSAGEGNDYTDNLPMQCMHPVGHWYEVPNLLRNGVLNDLLRENPKLTTLVLHNIDTVGADVDPWLLGLHASSGNALSFEVIARRVDDRGGGLARINGHPRLLEGLALPREEQEFRLSYYNTMTTWVSIPALLDTFRLSASDLGDEARVTAAIREVAARMPTYVTIKDVKKRWGHGQEDVFPVTQFEKLWSDMTALSDVKCGFLVVPRSRGQQLKEPAQLDGWVRDGSAAHVEALCDWG